MGLAKLSLPFGPETMLARVVRLLGAVARPIVVVAAPEQEVPLLPGEVTIVRDRHEGRGPLEGLRAGLAALPVDVELAYATSCDVPLLELNFVTRLVELIGEHEIAVPQTGGYYHPLSAIYRRRVLTEVEKLLAADRLRPAFLFDAVSTRRIAAEELTPVDPELRTLENLNHPQDYLNALARAGFTPDPQVLEQLQRSSTS